MSLSESPLGSDFQFASIIQNLNIFGTVFKVLFVNCFLKILDEATKIWTDTVTFLRDQFSDT